MLIFQKFCIGNYGSPASRIRRSGRSQPSAAQIRSFAAGFICGFERSKNIYLRKLLVLMSRFANCVCM